MDETPSSGVNRGDSLFGPRNDFDQNRGHEYRKASILKMMSDSEGVHHGKNDEQKSIGFRRSQPRRRSDVCVGPANG